MVIRNFFGSSSISPLFAGEEFEDKLDCIEFDILIKKLIMLLLLMKRPRPPVAG
jgi:hypothetical protein